MIISPHLRLSSINTHFLFLATVKTWLFHCSSRIPLFNMCVCTEAYSITKGCLFVLKLISSQRAIICLCAVPSNARNFTNCCNIFCYGEVCNAVKERSIMSRFVTVNVSVFATKDYHIL